ncbi:uncharacterized protein NH340_JMT06620 [Sarcoptes scabiei]|nr:uncharacterized protein NH340_JMT06620 [Sarcoptes scabiei]
MFAYKRPLANLGNILPNKNNTLAEKNGEQKLTKRLLDSPASNFQSKKKTIKQTNKNDENFDAFQNNKNDLTKSIEDKIKNIHLSSKPLKNVVARDNLKKDNQIKAIKSRATNQMSSQKKKIIPAKPYDWRDYYEPPLSMPADVIDHDRAQIHNIDSEPFYAYEIFNYFKTKELSTRCSKYMHKQKEITEMMRVVLVDWLVEVQQTFELNHETLYHAVKLIDHYLMKNSISRHRFQLLGITAVFVAAKLDERIYPIIDDFIYISDDAYDRDDIIKMEIELLKILDFDLNYPLSYSFLRRFARCSSQTIETLTLSRFILESSLMDYSFIDELDSKIAAASLLLALKMKNLSWNAALEFYSGYNESDLIDLMKRLNKLIKTKSKYETIRKKYSDKVFFEVANIRPLDI